MRTLLSFAVAIALAYVALRAFSLEAVVFGLIVALAYRALREKAPSHLGPDPSGEEPPLPELRGSASSPHRSPSGGTRKGPERL